MLTLPTRTGRVGEDPIGTGAGLLAEYGDMGVSLLDALCREELLPMVDAASQEIRLQRTPGTFAFDCAQATVGVAVEGSTRRSLDELRRKNLVLLNDVQKLEADKAKAVKESQAKLEREKTRAAKIAGELEEEKRAREEAERVVKQQQQQNGSQHSRQQQNGNQSAMCAVQ